MSPNDLIACILLGFCYLLAGLILVDMFSWDIKNYVKSKLRPLARLGVLCLWPLILASFLLWGMINTLKGSFFKEWFE